jgi:predicted Fe-S protein YdhL (DUF1289 family)
MSQNVINTPCIGVCTVTDKGLCMGCFRTMEEIGAWLEFTDTERHHIMEQLPARQDRLFS